MKIDLYNENGKKIGDVEVADQYFAREYHPGLIHQALVRQQAQGRRAIAKTKTRAEVRGGGRKPWKQKGTGRARFGSIRNPIWKGGGVVFGPRGIENYQIQMPKKQRRGALLSLLSEKVRSGQVIALDAFTSQEIKTKNFAKMVSELPIERSFLFVIAGEDAVFQKSAHNIPNARVIYTQYLNVSDLLKYRHVIFLKDALGQVEQTFSLA